MKKTKLKCYCCGKILSNEFSLVTMQNNADRVFVMLNEHVALVEEPKIVIKVRKI